MSFLPDGLANFAVFFLPKLQGLEGVRGARISGTTHSLEPFSEPEVRGKARGFLDRRVVGVMFLKSVPSLFLVGG